MKKGKLEGIFQTAANMKQMGLSFDIIHKAIGLSLAEIDAIDVAAIAGNLSC